MPRKLRRSVRVALATARYFSRMLVEYVATVWLLGIAPFLAHLAAASPHRRYAWMPAELYVFVMVVGANTAIEAFKDRRSDGPSRPLAALLGVSAAVFGAWAFGALEAHNAPASLASFIVVSGATAITLGIDLACRIPVMMRDAMHEANEKVGPR